MNPIRESDVRPDLGSLRENLRLQARELERLAAGLGEDCVTVIGRILDIEGRVVLCGMGKSGHVARKAAATLSSTGTPALFLHPSESLHGDLGMVTSKDMVLFISKSGENPELNLMLPSLRRMRVPIVAITAKRDCSLGRLADHVIELGEVKEICPLDLAPTTSTTLCLALLDAIAMELMRLRQFSSEDYAQFHPGGQLGRRLLFTVRDLMRPRERAPVIGPATLAKGILQAMTEGRMGAVLVEGEGGRLAGLVTDYDIRRFLEQHNDFFSTPAERMMNRTPSVCNPADNAYEVLLKMRTREKPITLMPVVGEGGEIAGLITLEIMVQHGLV
ncbi:MAG: KpsF/GutQ family sugar-phosphate isomerase [Planctomycetes bacterium]|nr:KpsF/GutQ family sugar-phosphate isomerase [Planctomycetota bacterium]